MLAFYVHQTSLLFGIKFCIVFSSIFDEKWLDKCPPPRFCRRAPPPCRDLFPTSILIDILVVLFVLFGSIWTPFGSLWVPFVIHWAQFGFLLAYIGLHFAPFGDPFCSIGIPFGLLSSGLTPLVQFGMVFDGFGMDFT